MSTEEAASSFLRRKLPLKIPMTAAEVQKTSVNDITANFYPCLKNLLIRSARNETKK